MTKAFIGDILAGEEEFLSGPGTHVDNEGNICASVIGEVNKNITTKEISVKGKLQLGELGDFVIAQVTDVRDKVVMLDISKIESPDGKIKVNNPHAGIILIANISLSFIESIRQAIKMGDVVRAKIVNIEPSTFLLSLKEPNCGVLMGFCSNCRGRLIAKEPDMRSKDLTKMECLDCKERETRRITKDYLFKKR